MKKSILSFVIIMFVVAIALVVGIAWFVLNNIPKFNGEFVKVLNIALIKPTFTAAAYNKAFYKFYFLYSNIPSHARKNITSDLNLLSSEVTNRTTASSSKRRDIPDAAFVAISMSPSRRTSSLLRNSQAELKN
jgi:hypothetical protein